MDILFIVSPDHLSNIYSMVTDYDFALQGYGNPKNAIAGLRNTNSEDIVGVCYAAQQLPAPGTTGFTELAQFVQKLAMIHFSRKVLFVSKIPGESTVSSLHEKFPSLSLYYSGVSEFSDKSIREQIFGSLLLGKYSFYKFDKKDALPQEPLVIQDSYNPIIPQVVFDIFSRVTKYGTLLQTLENDSILARYASSNPLYHLRRIVIAKKFGDVPVSMIQQLNESIALAQESDGADPVISTLLDYEFFYYAIAMVQGGAD